MREGASQEEESNSEDSAYHKRGMKEKIVKFGVGGTKEVEKEIFDSSKSNSGNHKENKEVPHVSEMVVPRCVDLIKDQFPKLVDRMLTPITISSPIKVGSKKPLTPLLCRILRLAGTNI